jgi:hypothetical protein
MSATGESFPFPYSLQSAEREPGRGTLAARWHLHPHHPLLSILWFGPSVRPGRLINKAGARSGHAEISRIFR